MKTRHLVWIIVPVGIIFLVVALYLSGIFFNEKPIKILIDTDKREYNTDETVHIRITNYEDHAVDILCPSSCALGNFPTTLEIFNNGDWEYLATFCPSIDPLFGNYQTRGDYIVHPLAPGDSYDLDLANFDALQLTKSEQLKVVYYMDDGRTMISSDEFTLTP